MCEPGQRNERWRLNRREEIGNRKIRGKSEKNKESGRMI
jgi:hypothetical protein